MASKSPDHLRARLELLITDIGNFLRNTVDDVVFDASIETDHGLVYHSIAIS